MLWGSTPSPVQACQRHDPRLTVYIGTSGWQYEHWRERFYPKDVPQRLWLEHYAEQFATVESNAAFYRLPRAEDLRSLGAAHTRTTS